MTLVMQNNSLRELWKFRALPRDCMASGMPASTSGPMPSLSQLELACLTGSATYAISPNTLRLLALRRFC